jgi:WD40 repeat protein
MRQKFLRELPGWLCQLPIVSDDWGEESLTLEGHAHKVEAVAFSLDGSLIASASSDTTVRL